MTQEKINRINALARKSKNRGLSEPEKAEQKALREEYLAGFRASMKAQLENTYIVGPDGVKRKVGKKQPYNGLRSGK